MSATGTSSGSTTLPFANRLNALCELNVIEQALNACRSTVVQDAWLRGQTLAVHGWVYGLRNGLLEDLQMTVTRVEDAASSYAAALATVKARGGAAP